MHERTNLDLFSSNEIFIPGSYSGWPLDISGEIVTKTFHAMLQHVSFRVKSPPLIQSNIFMFARIRYLSALKKRYYNCQKHIHISAPFFSLVIFFVKTIDRSQKGIFPFLLLLSVHAWRIVRSEEINHETCFIITWIVSFYCCHKCGEPLLQITCLGNWSGNDIHCIKHKRYFP
jgi:hypothetical protein